MRHGTILLPALALALASILLVSCSSNSESEALQTAKKSPPELQSKESKESKQSEFPANSEEEAAASSEEQGDKLLGPSLKTKSGLRLQQVSARPFEQSRLVLRVDAGTRRAPPQMPGLARLAAHCLIHAAMADDEGRGGSLSSELAELGASLHLDFGERYVRIEITCSDAQLEEAAALLAKALTQPAPSPEFVRWRARWLRHSLQARQEALQQRWQVAAALGLELPSPMAELRSLLSQRAAPVAFFLGSYYRPGNSLLLVASPRAPEQAKKQLEQLAKQLAEWGPGPELPKLQPPRSVHALSFAATPKPASELLAIVRAPSPENLGVAAAIAWQRLSLDGYGGLLGDALTAAGLSSAELRSESMEIGTEAVTILHLRAEPEDFLAAHKAISASFQQLTQELPLPAQFSSARERALLAWRVRLADPRTRLAIAEQLVDKQRQGSSIERRFRNTMPRHVVEAAQQHLGAGILLRAPQGMAPNAAFVIKEPQHQEFATAIGSGIELSELSLAERRASGKKLLALARAAIGGEDKLTQLTELAYSARCEYMGAIPFRENWIFEPGKQRAVRERFLLGSSIETRASDKGVFEDGPAGKSKLTGPEAKSFLLELQLQVPALLWPGNHFATSAELIGTQNARGRKLAVLQGQLESGQELRLAIDSENGLPRRLVYEEWVPGSPARQVTLVFRAYEDHRSLRLPGTIFRYVEDEYRGEAQLRWLTPKSKQGLGTR
ncbi:MAG: hypothetical protein CSA62_00760 [Planctomycetota bacterium]|nr:MAG: hypothetical protein CSA62_00760 [Planctomycetota bacterium]